MKGLHNLVLLIISNTQPNLFNRNWVYKINNHKDSFSLSISGPAELFKITFQKRIGLSKFYFMIIEVVEI